MSFSPSRWQLLLSYFKEVPVEKTSSEVNPCLEVILVNGKLVLNSLHGNYSFGGLHTAFREVFKKLYFRKRNVREVLILGFGAGSVAAILTKEYHFNCEITGVERDEKIIALAKKYFSLVNRPGLNVIVADAAKFLDTCREKYDLLVVDVYEDVTVPAFCESIPFLQRLNENLAQGGLILFNKFVYDDDSFDSALQLEKKFKDVFSNASAMKISGIYSNWMLVATKV